MKEIFFKYNNEEEFKKLQDILLELGYEWILSGKKKIDHLNSGAHIYDSISLKDVILSLCFEDEEECMEFYKGKINKDDMKVYIEAKKLNIL